MSSTGTVLRNERARARVIEYYRHCRNDYRILWRTDENGSIHFGYFDRDDPRPSPIAGFASSMIRGTIAVVASVAAACLALVPREAFREAAIRTLRVAARGRLSRHDAGQRRMTAVCAEAVRAKRGERILDAGCGVGGTDRWLSTHYGAFVCGLNVQHDQLVVARGPEEDTGHGRTVFSRQDYTEMGIAGESFDLVWGLESICHCEDKREFIREAYRVLRRGGRLMVADFFLVRDAMSESDAHDVATWTAGWAIPNLASTAGFEGLLAGQGFADIRYRDIRDHVLPSSKRLYKASFVAHPVHRFLERTGARSPIQGANIVAARLQYRTFINDVCTYGIFTAKKC